MKKQINPLWFPLITVAICGILYAGAFHMERTKAIKLQKELDVLKENCKVENPSLDL